MDRDSEHRALQIFEQAMGLTGDQLESFLAQACGDSVDVLNRVRRMMNAQAKAANLLRIPGAGLENETVSVRQSQASFDRGTVGVGSKLLDRYLLVAQIGSGGMGVVYRAFDERLDREVAIKTLSFAGLKSDELRARFDRETKAVAALSHPNIVTLYDFADHEGVRFAVMELINGKTLRELMSDTIEIRTAIECVRDTLLGLACAHVRNLMHRDIKPENVILDSSGRGKVLDFGIARPEVFDADQDLTLRGAIPGTAPYMSPEQAGSQKLTCATDLFSVGIMLYEVLTGINPFRGDGLLETLKRISAAEPPPIRTVQPKVPERLATLVTAMLNVDPDRRPTAQQAADQLSALLTDWDESPGIKTESARNSTTTEGNRETARRTKRWQPSLIILPLQTFGRDEQLEQIADGFVENLTTVLTRVPMLSLASRLSSFSTKGASLTASDLRQRFNVDYLVEGSLQRSGELIRANVQLIESKGGFHLWAQSFQVAPSDDAIQALLHQTLPRLEPQLIRAIFNDLRDESGELTSRQLVVQAMTVLTLKGWHRETFAEVAKLLRQSIALEPDLALAHAFLALIRGLGKRVGLVSDPEDAKRDAIAHAERALDLDQFDSNVLGLAGCALSDIGETDRAIPILKNAITINPCNAQAEAALGAAYLMIEDYHLAVEHLKRGIDLSPLDSRLAVWYALLAIGYFGLEATAEAITSAELGCQSDRKNYMPRVVLTALHCARDEHELAITAMRDCLYVKPDLRDDEIDHLVGPLGLKLKQLKRTIERLTYPLTEDWLRARRLEEI